MNGPLFVNIVTQLVLPPSSMVLGVLAGAALAVAGLRKTGIAVATLAIVEIAVLSFPPTGEWLIRLLEDRAEAAATRAAPCCYDAIVVLGGGIVPAMPPLRPDPHLDASADRVWHAARLYKRGVAPTIIVSGGPVNPASRPEAGAMRDFLIDLGVPPTAIVMEGKARNTIENIRNVRAIVHDGRVALVTSAFHMPRALKIAAVLHLDAAAFPTDFRALPRPRSRWEGVGIPTVESLDIATTALRELLALAFDFRAVDEPVAQ
jgi:uncharacterized SAM-binding protein YcdF (DUF218 family)